MSYLHCSACHRAYKVQPSCPSCGLRSGGSSDPAEDLVLAAQQFAAALARATPAQIAAAEARIAPASRPGSALVIPAPRPRPRLRAALAGWLRDTLRRGQAALAQRS